MKLQWNHTLRTSLCTAAVLCSAWAQAQAPAQPVPAPAAEPAMQHPHPSKIQHHPKHHKPHHTSNSGKYATPQQHENAAVQNERRQGTGPSNPQGAQLTEFQRNALRRCEIFKTHEDRSACVERVRQPQISGSISGGGVLREYTQTVTVPAPAQAAPPVNPAVHPHLVHPPVQPIRPVQ